MQGYGGSKWIGIAIGGLILLALPLIVDSEYWLHLFILAGLESIVIMGFVAQHRVRLLSFCVATFWGMGAYFSSLFAKSWGLNFLLCLPLSGIATAAIAFILGLVIVRASWVTFLTISIVIAEVFVEVIGHIDFLGGWDGITAIPRPGIGTFVFLSKSSYYYLTLALLVVCIFIFNGLHRSPIGRAWRAIGQSSDLAASVGINIFRYRMAAYLVSGFTAGLSGSLYAFYMSCCVPNSFDIVKTLYFCIAAVLGGLQFPIAGPVVGAIIMKVFPEVFRMTDKYEPIFVGSMIILCTIFFRRGVLGSLSKFSTRNQKRILEGEGVGNTPNK
jgi:branched-chain amino acid transport system permease protein